MREIVDMKIVQILKTHIIYTCSNNCDLLIPKINYDS